MTGVLAVEDKPKPLAPAFSAPNPPEVPPNPVCCLFNVPNSDVPKGGELIPTIALEVLVVLVPDVVGGLVALDALGKGGSESSNVTPKEEEGLNGLRPAKPVIWGFNGPTLALVPLPTPVGSDEVAAMALLELTFAG